MKRTRCSPRAVVRKFVVGAGWLALLTGCTADGAGHSAPHDGGARDSSARRADSGTGDATDAGSATPSPCPLRLPDGGYTIETDEDMAAIAVCTEINRPLTVTGNMLAALTLPKLRRLGGALSITKTSRLTSVDLPSLEQIDGPLTIDENAALATLRLASLTNVRDPLTITHNAALIDFDLDALTRTAFLTVGYNAALVTFKLPALETVGVFAFNQNDSLTTISFPALTSIDNDGFAIGNNGSLTTLSLPALTTLVGDILMIDNPMFPSCQIKALVERLGSNVPIAEMGNDDSATCP